MHKNGIKEVDLLEWFYIGLLVVAGVGMLVLFVFKYIIFFQ